MNTPKRRTNNLNAQTPYRTPVAAASGAQPQYHLGSHSVASSSTRGVAVQRAGAPSATPVQPWGGTYESPLPTRPRATRGDYLDADHVYGAHAPLLTDDGMFDDDDEDELFTRYSDYYYDPNNTNPRTAMLHGLSTGAEMSTDHHHTRRTASRSCCCCCEGSRCVRGALLMANALLLLASLAALLVGVVAKQALEDSLKNLCHDCDRLYNVYLVYTCVLIAAALLGCAMLLVRPEPSRQCSVRCGEQWSCNVVACCRGLYTFLLGCAVLVLGGWVLAYSLVLHGGVDLSTAWDRSISANRTDACFVQYRLECSGWDALCHATAEPNATTTTTTSTSTSSPSSSHVAPFQRTLCPSNCPEYMQTAIDTFNRTCAAVVRHQVRSKCYILLVPSAIMAAVVLLSLLTTCVAARCAPTPEEDPTDIVARRYTSSASGPRMAVSVVED